MGCSFFLLDHLIGDDKARKKFDKDNIRLDRRKSIGFKWKEPIWAVLWFIRKNGRKLSENNRGRKGNGFPFRPFHFLGTDERNLL